MEHQELRGLITALLAMFTKESIAVLANILELCDQQMLNVIRVELQTPFASVFVHDSIREWVLKFLEHLTPQAMLAIHEL